MKTSQMRDAFRTRYYNHLKVFYTPEDAYTYVVQSKQPLTILMGDYPEYWVTTPRKAKELVAEGYELLDE